MLEKLHIKNVALIEECDMTLGAGLNILTGETGAGKSMLIGSLVFALGGRTGKDFLRRGKQLASVEALFTASDKAYIATLEDNGIEVDEDGAVLVSRTLNENGKTVCRINGSMVTVGMLRELSAGLVDLYGQHDHQSLLNPSKHIALLDRFCGDAFHQQMSQYTQSYQKIKALDKQLDALVGDENAREQRLDILEFQKKEIEDAHLQIGEEEDLHEQKKRMSNLEKLIHLTADGTANLYEGVGEMPSACDLIGDALVKMKEASELDKDLEQYFTVLEEAYAQIDDTARELKRYAQSLEDDPQGLEEIEERLQLIYRLKRKYGNSVEEILAFYEKVTEELSFLSNSKEMVEALSAEKKAELVQLELHGNILTQIRVETGEQIATQIETSLQDMEMKHARFFVSIAPKDDWSANGRDKVEFLILTNAGEEAKPLAKIASGGEMSRVMLALKSVLVDADEIGTFIFDEIDSGVSGRTAGKVGEKMAFLANKRQILCITHLPQIAAKADSHFLIEKNTDGEETKTSVLLLSEDESVLEMARLLGSGELTQATLAAARELKSNK